LAFDISYKNFTLASRLIGKSNVYRTISGGRIPFNPYDSNGKEVINENGALYYAAMNDHWTPASYSGTTATENPNATYPRLAFGSENRNNAQQSTFWLRESSYLQIADIELGDRPLFLAPMEDVTDPSFRYMCKRFGADVVYTEFISSDGLIRDAGKSLAKLRIAESERPVGIQLYGHLVEPMVEAARIAEAADPDIIDINFGCPVKKIAGRGAGSGMMRDVPLMVEMTRRIVEAVKKPVTVKTRLGWDEESKNIEEIALRLQDVGIAALTIHGRTRAQMYRGEADWTLIGKVKNNPAIRIPIIGNGDIDSGPKAREMFDRYGVDGVMIGRATYGRPWIFREVKHFLETGEVMPQPSVAERVEIAKEHLAKSLEIKGDRVGILEMRRHLSNYFKGLPNFKETRLKLVTLFDPNELYATLDSIADRWGDFDVSGVIPAPLSHDV
jgi:nifR3 family TIM-barrel protein